MNKHVQHANDYMDDCLNKIITVVTNSYDEMHEVMEKIHLQLAGNPDYINNNIILNGSDDRLDGSTNTVCVFIFNECKSIPSITI